MSVVSVVPAAIQVLAGYMTQVADDNPGLNPGVYVGLPPGSVRNNFLMVGDPDGKLFDPESYEWAAVPGQARLRSESFALLGSIRAYSGSADVAGRVADTFTMLNALQELIVADPGGYAAGLTVAAPASAGGSNLSPSGSWGDLKVIDNATGPFGGQGWGVLITFQLDVINAQLSG